MSIVHNMFDEHKELLKSRKYDEESLNSPDKSGLMFKKLNQQIWKAVNESLYDNGIHDFELKAVGFFKNNAEMVFFDFKYSFDIENLSLKLCTLTVRMDGAEKALELKNSYELPRSEEALDLIRKEILTYKKGKTNPRIIDENPINRKMI